MHRSRRLDDDPLLQSWAGDDWDTASQSDTRRYARYFWGMIERGIYMPCSQFEAFFVSVAHSEADIEDTIAAAREALAESVQS